MYCMRMIKTSINSKAPSLLLTLLLSFMIIHNNEGRNLLSLTRTGAPDNYLSPGEFLNVYLDVLVAIASNDGPYCEGATIQLHSGPNAQLSYA